MSGFRSGSRALQDYSGAAVKRIRYQWNSTLKVSEKPIPKVNAKRMAKRNARAFGDKADMLRTQPCVMHAYGGCRGPIQVHHTRSRGAGGSSAESIPLCLTHHSNLHLVGRQTFEKLHGVDLVSLAAQYEEVWQSILELRK